MMHQGAASGKKCIQIVTLRTGDSVARAGRAMQANSVATPPPIKWVVAGARAVGGWFREDYRWAIFVVVVVNLFLMASLGYVREVVNHTQLVTVRVEAGSENVALLRDQETVAFFASKGIALQVKPLGSGQIAATANLHDYDAYLVSSDYFANQTADRLTHLTADQETSSTIQVFNTPLAVFIRRGVLRQLVAAGIVTTINGAQAFSVHGYIQAVLNTQRWSTLQGYEARWNGEQIKVRMTNPGKSDSGAMFVNAGAYVINNKTVVTSQTPSSKINEIVQGLGAVFGVQGMDLSTTEKAVADFTSGRSPMALGYESEARRVIPSWATWLPLDYTVDCVHNVVPVDAIGSTFASLLQDDHMQRLERQYHFEPGTDPTPQDPGTPVNEPSVVLSPLIRGVVKVATGLPPLPPCPKCSP
jgi:hypothetical protein